MVKTATGERQTRRDFLRAARGLAAVGLVGGSFVDSSTQATWAADQNAKASGMKLALSVRVAEAFGSKEKSSMTIDQLIDLAKRHGYQALCMRGSQAGPLCGAAHNGSYVKLLIMWS